MPTGFTYFTIVKYTTITFIEVIPLCAYAIQLITLQLKVRQTQLII
jgi:hypothetical protein